MVYAGSMAELEELLFGVKPNEPTPAKYKQWLSDLHSLEQLASFVETENENVTPPDTHKQTEKARTDQVCII